MTWNCIILDSVISIKYLIRTVWKLAVSSSSRRHFRAASVFSYKTGQNAASCCELPGKTSAQIHIWPRCWLQHDGKHNPLNTAGLWVRDGFSRGSTWQLFNRHKLPHKLQLFFYDFICRVYIFNAQAVVSTHLTFIIIFNHGH